MKDLNIKLNEKYTGDYLSSAFLEDVSHVREFHKGIPGYSKTPLVSLEEEAKNIGVGKIYLKDESKRFDLNAFKVLGGSYALSGIICSKLNLKLDKNTFNVLTSDCIKEKVSKITFATATDGNHGRGVAWASSKFGAKAYVYLPKGSSTERLENIRKLGAISEITDMNYDDTVRYVSDLSKKNGWVFVQDTSWDGYTEIPTSIVKGYSTIASEVLEDLAFLPTHVFLQAGVGAFAGAITGYLKSHLKDKCPKTIIVEPDKADCHYRSAVANDGNVRTVTGDMNSMMAGLCCGEPCSITWPILRDNALAFISCSDYYSALGMKLLHKYGIVSGESGAVTMGVLASLDQKEKDLLGIDSNSRILLISTEGDTDKENYIRVVNLP